MFRSVSEYLGHVILAGKSKPTLPLALRIVRWPLFIFVNSLHGSVSFDALLI